MTESIPDNTDNYQAAPDARAASSRPPRASSGGRSGRYSSGPKKRPRSAVASGGGYPSKTRAPYRDRSRKKYPPPSRDKRDQEQSSSSPAHRATVESRSRLDLKSIEKEELEKFLKNGADPIHAGDLKKMTIGQLVELTAEMGDQGIGRLRKQDIICNYLKFKSEAGLPLVGDGVIEVAREGHGFLCSTWTSYLPSSDDIFVSSHMVREYKLKTGDHVYGPVRAPRETESYFSLIRPDRINYDDPQDIQKRVLFSNLTPLHPDEHLCLESGDGSHDDVTARIIDIIAPIGKGQRGLLVASPKAGKTVILQKLACLISENHPDCHVIVLLIDERPEEVTEMQRLVTKGEVVSSTFDQPATRHVQVADMVIEKAKRLVECRKNVVILLDSITRLARAHNTVAPVSGRVLSGGVDSNALHRPKRFFGAARNVEEGGSLTIIATALVETGSRMDEVIYEEFKGTGNMEIHLERRLAEKRVYPAINVARSGTRREELLLSPGTLQKTRILRKVMHEMDSCAATEFLIKKIQSTESNEKFFESMNRI